VLTNISKGYDAIYIATSRGYKAIGIDLSPIAIDAAKECVYTIISECISSRFTDIRVVIAVISQVRRTRRQQISHI